MSDMMLHAVLLMPPGLWVDDSEIDKSQRYSRYIQASDRIKSDEIIIDELMAAVKNLRDVKGRHHSEEAFKKLMAVLAKVES